MELEFYWTIESELSLPFSLSQRDISLSRWQRDDENFLLGVYPLPGLFVNLPNESKISRCQRDDENFSLRVYHLFEEGRVNPQMGNFCLIGNETTRTSF